MAVLPRALFCEKTAQGGRGVRRGASCMPVHVHQTSYPVPPRILDVWTPLSAYPVPCPPDIGLQQAGVAEAVVQAVTACHPALAPLLFSNVVVTGGRVS